jgi:D-glycero-D-manno-heptose 1,7-bisphosphate phosphatase
MSGVEGVRPALFVDRDGTLMVEVDHCHDPKDVMVYPGAAEVLAQARSLGWAVIIITNQSGIGRGYFTVEQFESVQAELIRQLNGAVDASYMAPDHPDNPSPRRKPAPGMILEASTEHGIDLERSFMIGDKDIDIECGRNAGARTILVETGYGKKNLNCGADFIAPTVTEAVRLVLAGAL